MRAYLESVRPELKLTDEARVAVGHLLTPQPAGTAACPAGDPDDRALSVATLPRWARRLYGLPGLPTTDLSATVTLRALQTATARAARPPGPPDVERARRLVRAG